MRNPYALENFRLYLSINYPSYILLDDSYDGVKSKMRFMCLKHREKGVQYNTIDNIVNNNHACKYCSYEKMRDDRVVKKEVLVSMCDKKNVSYIGQYTKDHETIVQYICETHSEKGVQEMSLTHFKESVVPCHYCGKSAGELQVSRCLDNMQIMYVPEKKFKNCKDKRVLRFDFYLPDFNTAIEYDGRQHFEPVKFWNRQDANSNFEKTKVRDAIKTKFCRDNNIRLIRIPYFDYNRIEEILRATLV